MNLLDYLAIKYLLYRLREFKREGCITEQDWQDGMVYADHGCFQCKANLTSKFLEEYISL